MGAIRNTETLDNTVSYIATLAFFCCVSCVILMFKFGGFKASLNFYNGSRRKSKKERQNIGSIVSINGAYRTNRDEFFGYNYYDTRKSTQLTVPVTSTDRPTTPLRQVKSTSDLIKDKNLAPNLLQENPGISQDPRGAEHDTRNNKTQENDKTKERKLDAHKRVEKQRLEEQNKVEKQRLQEQKKLEKKVMAEQQKQGKLILKEQARKDKLRREMEKKAAQKAKKDKQKKKAPQPPVANPLGQANASTSANPLAQVSGPTHSTNTLDSSISKSSGPPPYSAASNLDGEKDISGNVTYVKPVDTGSWDMVSKHRENINRPVNVGVKKAKQPTVMDLNYKVGEGSENRDNSEV